MDEILAAIGILIFILYVVVITYEGGESNINRKQAMVAAGACVVMGVAFSSSVLLMFALGIAFGVSKTEQDIEGVK